VGIDADHQAFRLGGGQHSGARLPFESNTPVARTTFFCRTVQLDARAANEVDLRAAEATSHNRSMNATPLAAYGPPPVVERDASPRPATPQSLPSLLEAYETSLILAALAATGGHQRRAARILGVGATTLHAKLKRLHLEHTPHLHALPGESRAGREEFRWRGRLETARAVEVRVVNGDIRIEGCPGVDTVEIVAQKHGRPLGSTPLSVEIDVSQVEAGLSIAAARSRPMRSTRTTRPTTTPSGSSASIVNSQPTWRSAWRTPIARQTTFRSPRASG
jgi:hypothetical protein